MNMDEKLREVFPSLKRASVIIINNRDDATQEGLIAAWKELEKGSPIGWGIRSGKLKMQKIASGRPYLGEECHRGGNGTKILQSDKFASVENTMPHIQEHGLDAAPIRDIDTEVFIGSLLLPLTGRDLEYVWLAFWLDLSQRQIAALWGESQSFVARRWREHIRPQLQQRYAELSGNNEGALDVVP